MSDGFNLNFGIEQLTANLQNIPQVLAKKIARPALEAGGEVIVLAAEATAPVRTGELKEDIVMKVHIGTTLHDNYVLVGPGYNRGELKTSKRTGKADSSSSPGVYGKFVEVGHAPPGMANEKRKAKRNGKEVEFGGKDTPPHPWLRPAFETSKERAVEAMTQVLRAGLEGVARGTV